jgi:hypothetical protein
MVVNLPMAIIIGDIMIQGSLPWPQSAAFYLVLTSHSARFIYSHPDPSIAIPSRLKTPFAICTGITGYMQALLTRWVPRQVDHPCSNVLLSSYAYTQGRTIH